MTDTNENLQEEIQSETILEEKEPKKEIDYKDLYIRLLAEQQNQQKRMQTELSESISFANQRFIKELTPILDTFDLALKYNPQDQGIIMIKNQFIEFLTKYGFKMIAPEVGHDFDPNKHEALGKEKNENLSDGQISSVAQNGYMLHDRVIRSARVMIVDNKIEQE